MFTQELWLRAAFEKPEDRRTGGINCELSMKTEAMSSPQADAENINMALPELPKRWKSRLHRFQRSLRHSVRLKKRNSSQSASCIDGEHRGVLENDHENCLANRSDKHVRRDKHNGPPPKQLNGKKTTLHSHYVNGKTSLDSYGFDKRKFEQSKTNGNNNQSEKKNAAESTSRPADVSELAGCSQVGSTQQKKSHKTKRQSANTNTEKTSLSKSKSLSILTNLFKRSSHSKDKNNRGKNSSFADAKTSLSKDFSTATINSTDFDALVTDTVVSSSSIDSFGDNDSRFKGSKYYSLKRSKKSLVFPKNYLPRSFSLDNSLDPCNDCLMEKSRTLAAIPPCIRVEEYRENRGCFERSLTVEFNLGSSGSVTIDTGPEYYQKMTGCSASRTEVLASYSHSCGAPKNGVEPKTAPNITYVAEKSSDAWKRQSAPPILSFSTDKNSSNIGSPISHELKTDIVKVESRSQLEGNIGDDQSDFSEKGNSSSETVECCDILKSDMGNNLSYGMQKQRKFNSKDVKFKSAILRSIKKNGKTFHVKSYDGEEDPIIEQTDYLESFERELENGRLNYLTKDVSPLNEVTKEKSNSLYGGSEALGISELKIDGLQGNNYTQNFSDLKSTADWNSSGNQSKENPTAEEKCTCENTERLPNEKVNKEEVCEEKCCSSTFGQTGHNDSSKQGDCLSCKETRNKLTDTQFRRCSPVCPEPSSREANLGVLSEQKLRDHISAQLITCGLGEICNSDQGLVRNLKVNSLPCSPRESVLPVGTMHSSFPDIRKLHSQHLSPKLSESQESFSSCSLHVEHSFQNNPSIDRSEKINNPLLSNGLSNFSKHGGIVKSNLSLASPEERQRSCSARIPFKSPLHQVLQTENRSASCSQLDKDDNDTSTCTSPPYVRPRIQSLEELPPCTAAVILRKKKSIIRKTRMKHTASLSFVDNEFNSMIDKSKRHSYGGYGDRTFLELPHLLHRSQSAESQLDSCNSSLQSVNSSSSFTENELGSTFSIMSELSIPGFLDKGLGRSRSVPGLFGIADMRQNSPIPEERASVSEMEFPSKSAENSDDGDDDDDDDDVDGEVGRLIINLSVHLFFYM